MTSSTGGPGPSVASTTPDPAARPWIGCSKGNVRRSPERAPIPTTVPTSELATHATPSLNDPTEAPGPVRSVSEICPT